MLFELLKEGHLLFFDSFCYTLCFQCDDFGQDFLQLHFVHWDLEQMVAELSCHLFACTVRFDLLLRARNATAEDAAEDDDEAEKGQYSHKRQLPDSEASDHLQLQEPGVRLEWQDWSIALFSLFLLQA